jgi:hypothetical protein
MSLQQRIFFGHAMPAEATEPALLSAIITYFLTWLPLFVLIGVFLFVYARTGYLRRGGMNHSRYLEEVLSETKRQNEVLAALLTKMDARLSQLEAAQREAKKTDA